MSFVGVPKLYPGLSNNFALSIGGEFSPGQLKKDHIIALAETLAIKSDYLLKIASDMAASVSQSIPKAVEKILPHLNHSEKRMAERLQQTIASAMKKITHRIALAET